MPLNARDHQRVQHDTKTTRNEAAKARRATLATKYTTVRLVEARWFDGTEVLLAWSPGEPWHAYLLRRDESGAWKCLCFNARRSIAADCAHQQAANRPERTTA